MSQKLKTKFMLEDEEKIIDFVKSNEILYNVKHNKFRDSEAKNRLWLKLAESMELDGKFFQLFPFVSFHYFIFGIF